MGAGKTSVGRILSERLGWRFIDLDREIEARCNKSIAEIFQLEGESGFRLREAEALRSLLVTLPEAAPTIVALGGGAFTQAANLELLDSVAAKVVFLDAPVDELQRRIGEDDTRPLSVDAERFRQLYEERHALYRRAPHRIQTDGKTVLEVAREIESLLREQ